MVNVLQTKTLSLQNGNVLHPEWILDTGAIDHICTPLSFFTSFRISRSITVSLPNDNKLISYYSGSIHLTSDLILIVVLYLPTFHYNFISITKLTHSLKYKVTLSPKFLFHSRFHLLIKDDWHCWSRWRIIYTTSPWSST